MQYTCEVCGGEGYIKKFQPCFKCDKTGQKQITISLEEYDRLKLADQQINTVDNPVVLDFSRYKALMLAEKQRDKAIELAVHGCKGVFGKKSASYCRSIDCKTCTEQAILSYGKEDEK